MPLRMKYFVLKPRGGSPHAHASREAILAYARAIESTDLGLSVETTWADRKTRLIK